MLKWSSLVLAVCCLAVAPLWMAPGSVGCPNCVGWLIDMLIRRNDTGWHEFGVIAGKRQFLQVNVLTGQAEASLVHFDPALKLRKWGCVSAGAETRCEFFPLTGGQLGVAVEALEDAEVELEYGVADN